MIKANGLHAISFANRQVTTVCYNTNVFHYFPSYLLYNSYKFMMIIYNSFTILSIFILEKVKTITAEKGMRLIILVY